MLLQVYELDDLMLAYREGDDYGVYLWVVKSAAGFSYGPVLGTVLGQMIEAAAGTLGPPEIVEWT